jgi:aspartokinase
VRTAQQLEQLTLEALRQELAKSHCASEPMRTRTALRLQRAAQGQAPRVPEDHAGRLLLKVKELLVAGNLAVIVGFGHDGRVSFGVV